MIRFFTNSWVISFVVLAAVSFGITYGILTLLRSDDGGEFVVPVNSQVGVGTEADIEQPPAPTDVPTAGEQPESPAESTEKSPVDLKSDSPDAELVVADAIETIVTTGEGEEIAIESPATDGPPPSGDTGDSAGVGSVVEFTITRAGQ
jgi:hypothetical protein